MRLFFRKRRKVTEKDNVQDKVQKPAEKGKNQDEVQKTPNFSESSKEVFKEERGMKYTTTAEHEALRKEIREWAENEIKPIAFELDQNNQFPEEQIHDFASKGYMGLPFPEEYGGMGKDTISYAIGVEELSRVDGGTGVILSGSCVLRFLSHLCLWYRGTKTEIFSSPGKRRKNRRLRLNRNGSRL